jgi:hypothetical protein
MGMAGGLCPVLKVVRDLDAVIVLEPGESLKKRKYVKLTLLLWYSKRFCDNKMIIFQL